MKAIPMSVLGLCLSRALLELFSILPRFGKVKSAPLCEFIQKSTNSLPRAVVHFVFDMKYQIAHVPSNHDSIRLQLAQIVGQHLLGGSRNEPRELTQAYRARSHGKEDLYSPLTLEEHTDCNGSVTYVSCIYAIHIAPSA